MSDEMEWQPAILRDGHREIAESFCGDDARYLSAVGSLIRVRRIAETRPQCPEAMFLLRAIQTMQHVFSAGGCGIRGCCAIT